jgi:hypothetical protein
MPMSVRPRESGDPERRAVALDSRLRGNERRFGALYGTKTWVPATSAGMTDGWAEDCNELDALD